MHVWILGVAAAEGRSPQLCVFWLRKFFFATREQCVRVYRFPLHERRRTVVENSRFYGRHHKPGIRRVINSRNINHFRARTDGWPKRAPTLISHKNSASRAESCVRCAIKQVVIGFDLTE